MYAKQVGPFLITVSTKFPPDGMSAGRLRWSIRIGGTLGAVVAEGDGGLLEAEWAVNKLICETLRDMGVPVGQVDVYEDESVAEVFISGRSSASRL